MLGHFKSRMNQRLSQLCTAPTKCSIHNSQTISNVATFCIPLHACPCCMPICQCKSTCVLWWPLARPALGPVAPVARSVAPVVRSLRRFREIGGDLRGIARFDNSAVGHHGHSFVSGQFISRHSSSITVIATCCSRLQPLTCCYDDCFATT